MIIIKDESEDVGIPEKQDPGPWWDPRGTLEKLENRDPGPLWEPRKMEKLEPRTSVAP